MVFSAVFAACSTDGHGFKPKTSTNSCGYFCRHVNEKGSTAMLTSVQSAGVIPEVNLRNRALARKCRSKKFIMVFKSKTDITLSKIGVPVVP